MSPPPPGERHHAAACAVPNRYGCIAARLPRSGMSRAQLGHLRREVFGIAQDLFLRATHQDEGGLPAAQHLVGAIDPALEVLEELAHAREEIRYLRQRRDPRRLLEASEKEPRRPVHGAERGPAGGEVGPQEPADDL